MLLLSTVVLVSAGAASESGWADEANDAVPDLYAVVVLGSWGSCKLPGVDEEGPLFVS